MAEVVTIGICVGSMAMAERGKISPSGRPGVRADSAATKALDADRQEVARQVALDQHRCAAAAQQIAGTATAEYRRGADLDEMRRGLVRRDR